MKINLKNWVCHSYKGFYLAIANFNGGFGVAFHTRPHSLYLTSDGKWVPDDYTKGKVFRNRTEAHKAVDKLLKNKNTPPGY